MALKKIILVKDKSTRIHYRYQSELWSDVPDRIYLDKSKWKDPPQKVKVIVQSGGK